MTTIIIMKKAVILVMSITILYNPLSTSLMTPAKLESTHDHQMYMYLYLIITQ